MSPPLPVGRLADLKFRVFRTETPQPFPPYQLLLSYQLDVKILLDPQGGQIARQGPPRGCRDREQLHLYIAGLTALKGLKGA